MEPKDVAASDSRGDENEPSLCHQIAMELFSPIVYLVVTFYLIVATLVIVGACGAIDFNEDNPMTSSVELVGVKGLEPAQAPGAVSPAFNLLVRVDNGHIYDQCREGGSVTVSYAGVPLGHGRSPSFCLGAKAALNFTVNATTQAVGVPEDLFRLMSAERRWGVAQLEVRMQLGPGWESYSWSVDLDG